MTLANHSLHYSSTCPEVFRATLENFGHLAAHVSEMAMVGFALEYRSTKKVKIIASKGYTDFSVAFPDLDLSRHLFIDYITDTDEFVDAELIVKFKTSSLFCLPKHLDHKDYSRVILFGMDTVPHKITEDLVFPLINIANLLQENLNQRFKNDQEVLLNLPAIYTRKIGHDLKNPLNNIQLVLELIEQSGGLKDADKDPIYRGLMTNAAKSLSGKIEALTRLSATGTTYKITKTRFQSDDLIAKLESAFASENQRLEFEYESRSLVGDQKALFICLEEIIKNALEYSRKGSIVRVYLHTQDHQLKIEVLDVGPGIDIKYQEHIFNPFECGDRPTEREGKVRGMGLAIVKMLMYKMNGFLSLDSGKNLPTSVTLELCDAIA